MKISIQEENFTPINIELRDRDTAALAIDEILKILSELTVQVEKIKSEFIVWYKTYIAEVVELLRAINNEDKDNIRYDHLLLALYELTAFESELDRQTNSEI